ncbi:MAG: hypothetical protein NT022_00625 [Deltaproteobacteria bacterium]|nr:hypothetical protein [Deltaproteobacteria bacterium]
MEQSEIRYLNTDLIIESPNDLSPIAESFGEEVIVLYNGAWGKVNRAIFEVEISLHASANETIETFCALIEGLKEKERAIWDACFSKIFDIGFESGLTTQSFSSQINQDTIKRLAAIGASIEITIYPPIPEEEKR